LRRNECAAWLSAWKKKSTFAKEGGRKVRGWLDPYTCSREERGEVIKAGGNGERALLVAQSTKGFWGMNFPMQRGEGHYQLHTGREGGC